MVAGSQNGAFPKQILFSPTGSVNQFYMTDASNGGLYSSSTIHLGTNVNGDLGNGGAFTIRRFGTGYFLNSPNVSSDQRLKTDIQDSDLGLDFVCNLRPVKYKKTNAGVLEVIPDPNKKIDNDPTITYRSGVRDHYGFIAQEVKQALDTAGPGSTSAIWSLGDKNDPDSMQALTYEEFISPMVKAIQELSAKVEQLTQRLNDAGIAP
jgi:hypothetical protein